MIDAIVSYHTKADVCGVTKFNQQLAAKLSVPHYGLFASGQATHPLLSLKASELSPLSISLLKTMHVSGGFSVLWHDAGIPEVSAKAEQVWYAKDLGCPSTLRGKADRPGVTVLTFGFAHKFQVTHFERLRDVLDRLHAPYTVCVSTGIHEGHPWDVTTAENETLMRGVFGDHLRYLGFLADDALAKEIREAHMIALFYHPAVRANNTTLWAALEAGTPVITNLDADSPVELLHATSVFDLAQLTEWPDAAQCREVRAGGLKAASVYSWDRVIQILQQTTVHV
jgi:hypothetical protein